MRLIVQEHRAADIVAVYLFVGVGTRHETADQLGYAHFQEHMLFKGTDKFGPGYVDRVVEGVGGKSNAVTSFDYTTFYLILPTEATATGIQLLSDMAFRSTFAPEEVVREREVIFEEARIEQDNPRSAILRQLYALVFAGHPYGRPVLGTRETMMAATQERLRAFNRRYYPPENMTLVVAGPVEPGAVRAMVDRSFGRPAAGFKPTPPPAPRPIGGRARALGGARGAAGPPGPGLAGPALRRRGGRRGGPAEHHPGRHRELAAGAAAARRRAAGLERDHELLRPWWAAGS